MSDALPCIVCGQPTERVIGFGCGPRSSFKPVGRCANCDPPDLSTPESEAMRAARVEARIGLRGAAQLLGVRVTELSGWETGRLALPEGMADRAMAKYREGHGKGTSCPMK